MATGIAIAAVLIFLYAAVALWLGRRSMTMPMVFVAVGFVLGPGGTGLLPIDPDAASIKVIIEVTLALLLFADASTLSLAQVRRDAALPARLLVVSVLIIALGAAASLGLFPAEGLAFAALIGTILAPTDAALGMAIFSNPKVPTRIRRALNVESGFNDGIAAPFVMLFVAFALSQEAGQENWPAETAAEIGFALLIGVVVGVAGGWVLQQAAQRGWTAPSTEQFAVLGLAAASYFSAVAIHGNGFIAAFIAGLFFASVTKERFHEPTEFTESLSSFLSLAIWIIFGAVLVEEAFAFTSDWRPITYAVLSLTIVRMIPVAVSMLGTGLRTDTVLMMGWFGPRGLASVVFTMLAFIRFEDAGRPIEVLVTITTWTILLSVFAHGLSAQPLAKWYARRLATAPAESPELADVPELRARHTSRLSPHDDSP